MTLQGHADIAGDLSACAREPIHTPGAIQPYGLALVLDGETLTVIERAVSRPALLQALGDPLDQPVEQALGGLLANSVPVLRALAPGTAAFLGSWSLASFGRHHAIAHRCGGHVIVELEEPVAAEPGSLEELYPAIRVFMAEIEQASDTAALCAIASRHVRALTGFDRTLVYQFDAEWNGRVVAEDRNEVLPSYLDLRFPEADIPAQARALYERNRVRLIAANDYQAVPLLRSASRADAPPTDLSLSVLRSVSPVHLQYMRNMGTGASMSVSLMREGRLWGLISCHSAQPRRVPYHVRTACEFIGQILSLQLALKERALSVEERVARRAIQMQLLGRMAGDTDFLGALGRDPARLMALTDATGVAIVHRGDGLFLGDCPTRHEVLALVEWLSQRGGEDIFCTDSLPALWEGGSALAARASGVLAVSVSQLHDSYVIWFRGEVVRTVRWGGMPAKQVDNGVLSPRASFEAWKETVVEQSLPWSDVDREAALELRVAIVDVVLRKAEELAELNEQLMRSNKELEAFSYSVSHDLRAPFRHIVGYAELLNASAGERMDPTEKRFLDTIVESAKSAGTLVDDLLSFSQMGRSTMGRSKVDMSALAMDVRQKLDMEYDGRNIDWRIPALPQVEGDPAMLRLVWQNLIGNAIKFTRDSASPRIEIGHRREGGDDIFFVRDNGCGFDMRYVDKLFGVFQRLHHADEYEGTGIGLANVRRIIGRHGGRTWAEGALGAGATLYFSLPHSAGAVS